MVYEIVRIRVCQDQMRTPWLFTAQRISNGCPADLLLAVNYIYGSTLLHQMHTQEHVLRQNQAIGDVLT